MTAGPRGDRRAAGIIGCAVWVAQLSVGGMEGNMNQPSGRVWIGQAGVKARTTKVAAEQRREMAENAAAGRWG